MQNKFVPINATATKSNKIVIDFQYYRDDKCELKKISKTGIVRKILKFIMKVGQCSDTSELHELLKGNNACDMSKSSYQELVPEDMKIYEIWHSQHTPERVFYTRAGYTFYPVLFVNNH